MTADPAIDDLGELERRARDVVGELVLVRRHELERRLPRGEVDEVRVG